MMMFSSLVPARALAIGTLSVATLLGCAHSASASPFTTFSASTYGCFTSSASCTPTLQLVTSNNLTFEGVADAAAAIDANTPDTANLFLGTFTIPDPSGNVNPGSTDTFDLRVQFNDPVNSSAGIFSALLQGRITGGPNDSVKVDFSQTPITYSYSNAGGSGTFELLVMNDPLFGVTGDSHPIASPSSVPLFGRIQNVTYTSASDVSLDPAAVPEPASLLLFGTGLIGCASRLRRKRK